MRRKKLNDLDEEILGKLLIKSEWQDKYCLAFFCRANEPIPNVVTELLKFRLRHPREYRGLITSIKTQLAQEDVVRNTKRVRQGTPYENIYEFKSGTVPGIRLFFFFDADEIIVCTHAWWKAKESRQEQNKEFQKADKMRMQERGEL